MTTLKIEDLEANLRDVIERVHGGETVLISRDGEPVAQLSPCDTWATLEQVFPGIERATKQMRDIHIEPVRLNPPVDAVTMLIEDRDDRESLP